MGSGARLETLWGPHRLAYGLGRPDPPSMGCFAGGISRLSVIDRPTRTVLRYNVTGR
jgi:hypothetical protein